MIEEARAVLRTWGAAEPNFLLCNSKLTFQMTMIPEKTQYLTQGPDGQRKLREGPDIGSYRGLKIINTRAFSMEEGAPPRDVLRRRVRVAEYYRIPYEMNVEQKSFAFYDESKARIYIYDKLFVSLSPHMVLTSEVWFRFVQDAWQKFSWHDLFRMAQVGEINEMDGNSADWDDEDAAYEERVTKLPNYGITDMAVDVFIKRDLFDHMTVGGFRGDWVNGFQLEAEGNLVLNPWYAMHGIEIQNNGRGVPMLDPARAAAFGVLRQPEVPRPVPGGAGPARNYPPAGNRYIAAGLSEHAFSMFPEYLEAFGYRGNMNFASKSDGFRAQLIAKLQLPLPVNTAASIAAAAAGGALVAFDPLNAVPEDFPAGFGIGAAPGIAEGIVNGTTAIRVDREVCYTAILNRDEFNGGCLRGQPDYEHSSYREARHNFFRFLMLYLSGRSDRLPHKAKEFFDNFNWQRFGGLAGPAARLPVFAELLARAFHVERQTAGPYPGAGRAGLPIPGLAPGVVPTLGQRRDAVQALLRDVERDRYELVVVRPNIEHNMLGIIMGRGGLDELGATFWGQTELSCYDDSMHGELPFFLHADVFQC